MSHLSSCYSPLRLLSQHSHLEWLKLKGTKYKMAGSHLFRLKVENECWDQPQSDWLQLTTVIGTDLCYNAMESGITDFNRMAVFHLRCALHTVTHVYLPTQTTAIFESLSVPPCKRSSRWNCWEFIYPHRWSQDSHLNRYPIPQLIFTSALRAHDLGEGQ